MWVWVNLQPSCGLHHFMSPQFWSIQWLKVETLQVTCSGQIWISNCQSEGSKWLLVNMWYIYIYTYTHAHIYIYICLYIHLFIYLYMWIWSNGSGFILSHPKRRSSSRFHFPHPSLKFLHSKSLSCRQASSWKPSRWLNLVDIVWIYWTVGSMRLPKALDQSN